jgi:hypothetical protein
MARGTLDDEVTLRAVGLADYYLKCSRLYARALEQIRDESHVGSKVWNIANKALTTPKEDIVHEEPLVCMIDGQEERDRHASTETGALDQGENSTV